MRFYSLIFLFCIATTSYAQSPYVLPGTITDDIADRWEILYNTDQEYLSAQRNRSRKDINLMAKNLAKESVQRQFSTLDLMDIDYILNDNIEYTLNGVSYSISDTTASSRVYDSLGVFYHMEDNESVKEAQFQIARKPILKYFYKSKANFFEVLNDDFSFVVNPILNLRYGNAQDDAGIIFQNTRGIEMRGLIDDKIYFYTSLLENQQGYNNYIDARIARDNTIPGQGFFKPYNSAVIENLTGYDFLNAQAYIGGNITKSVAIEFGHGKHFIGNGVRSLFLSDYGHNYFYLKFNTQVWKFNYQNIFAELAPIASAQNPSDRLLPKKYMANHYLSFRPTQNLEFGIFETIMFSRENRFEFQYLNPVILYRTVEQFLDSPDNVLIGLSGKWNIKNKYQLYSQLILDEFKLGQLIAANGWWANKYGIQVGAKAVNFLGIDHLDAQVEYNLVRPYTYAHRDSLIDFPLQSTASYSHHNQPLAHPLGSNFKELIVNIRYRPTSKIFVNARAIRTMYAQDPQGENFGNNILIISGTRVIHAGEAAGEGHKLGQGIATSLMSLSLDVSYQFAHNYFIDLNILYRNADAKLDDLDIETKYIGAGLRVNLGQVKLDY